MSKKKDQRHPKNTAISVVGFQQTKQLRWVITSIIGIAFSIAVFSIALSSSIVTYRAGISTAEDNFSDIAETTAMAIENKIGWILSDISSIANSPTIIDQLVSTEEKLSYLSSENSRLGYQSISFTNSSGDKLITPSETSTNLSDRDYFISAMAGNPMITSPFYSEVRKEMVVIAAAPVFRGGKADGMVYAVMPSSTVSDIVKDIVISESGYAYLLDEKGTIIAHPNADYVDTRVSYIERAKTEPDFAEAGKAVSQMISETSGIKHYRLYGHNNVSAFDTLKNKWTVVVFASIREITASTVNSIITIIATSVIVLLIIMIITSFVTRIISDPVTAAAKRLQGMVEGDLTTPVFKSNSKSEIGSLVYSLERMLATMQGIIGEISSVLASLASGDLTCDVRGEYRGDFSVIKSSLVTICASLNETLGAINVSGSQVNNGAIQVSSTAQMLSQGATEQASAIEELSATISEVSESIKRSAENSLRASKLSGAAIAEVQNGNRQMTEMLAAMDEISAASSQIHNIIKVIDNIAFQTNILALNAAVEAARAGAAGKGFAVVADEVRNLAGKSAAAASQTTELIESSVAAVRRGSDIAQKTAESLGIIASETTQISVVINEISVAAEKQADAAQQINTGIEQISSVVQTNSATAEESAAASEELSGQAAILREQISKFKLTSGAGTAILGSGNGYIPKISDSRNRLHLDD